MKILLRGQINTFKFRELQNWCETQIQTPVQIMSSDKDNIYEPTIAVPAVLVLKWSWGLLKLELHQTEISGQKIWSILE